MEHIAHRTRHNALWGTPFILRCWQVLKLESRMLDAMTATADRLYAPFLHFKMGATLPDGTPWIPDDNTLARLRANINMAFMADFRALVTNSTVDGKNLFPGERMSNFQQDLTMFDKRKFMAFGLTDAIFDPNTQNYASTAVSLKMVTQLMETYQKDIIRFVKKRMLKVAEAHQHYEVDKEGTPITEKHRVWDEETQEYVLLDVPKLLVPDVSFETVNFDNEDERRKLLLDLRNQGLPIPNSQIAIGLDFKVEETAEEYKLDRIRDELRDAEVHMAIIEASKDQGLPIPPATVDYIKRGIPPASQKEFFEQFEEWYDNAETATSVSEDMTLSGLPPAVPPTEDAHALDGDNDGYIHDEAAPGQTPSNRPAVSDEQRGSENDI
jgi:hypothetical protein